MTWMQPSAQIGPAGPNRHASAIAGTAAGETLPRSNMSMRTVSSVTVRASRSTKTSGWWAIRP